MFLEESVQSITSSLTELKVDRAAIEKIKTSLNHTIHELRSSSSYKTTAKIAGDSFGTTFSATNLTFHHGLAHTVVDEMMDALTQDLNALAENLLAAVKACDAADTNAGTDLKVRQKLLNDLTYTGDHSSVPGAYDHARNHTRPPVAPATPAGSDGRGA